MGERRSLGDGSNRTVLEDGSVVGRYRLEYLASGGMSAVYRGEKDGKTVVLKEVSASNTSEVPSLISEKGLLERLNHPGVVGYEGFFNENGYYYLVLEYVPGKPLSQYLNPDNLAPVETVADWGVQLCDIFEYLHAQDPPIIYRDLKAENILIQDGKIRLIDFGIARLHKGMRAKDTELMGSPATASPEHYGGAETDARSDIYTLGASLYELFTGGRRKQVGAFQFAPVRELNPKVSPELEKVIDKATRFKPNERFQTASEMREALLKALGRPVPKSSGQSNRTVDQSVDQRGGNPRWVVALLVLAVLGMGGWIYYQHQLAVQSPFYGGPVESIGSYEASLPADIFGAGDVNGKPAVLLGDDIGLFQVAGKNERDAFGRAKSISKRLNAAYHTACIACGGTGLEPSDIKVGRHIETGETVVFYAHMHGSHLEWGPELLTTVTTREAETMGLTPRFVASYWRDLIRDTVNLSRGFEVTESALGPELSEALLKARGRFKKDAEQLTNLKAVLQEVSGRESLRLKDIFLTVPDRKPKSDAFENVEGYEPLTL